MKILYVLLRKPQNEMSVERLFLNQCEHMKIKPEILIIGENFSSPKETHIRAPRVFSMALLKLGFIGWYWKKKEFQKKFLAYVESIKPDVIINHTHELNYLIPHELKIPVINKQHLALQAYKFKDLPWPLSWLMQMVIRPKKSMRLLGGIGAFTQKDVDGFNSWLNKKNEKKIAIDVWPNFANVPSDFVLPKPEERSAKGIYLGRLVGKHKKLRKMCRFARQNKVEIDVYGRGSKYWTRYVSKAPFINYKGFTSNEPVALNAKYDFNICISDPRLEGAQLQFMEALSAGTKIIGNKHSKLHPFALELYEEGLLHSYKENTWKTAKHQQKIFPISDYIAAEEKLIKSVINDDKIKENL